MWGVHSPENGKRSRAKTEGLAGRTLTLWTLERVLPNLPMWKMAFLSRVMVMRGRIKRVHRFVRSQGYVSQGEVRVRVRLRVFRHAILLQEVFELGAGMDAQLLEDGVLMRFGS